MNRTISALISVIIPVYNGERTIRRAIDSILVQTYPDFEIIVVNDASTDNTKSILNSLKDTRIKIIHINNNIGRSAARNLAINKAGGEYIALLDADDYAYPNRLKEQINYMRTKNILLCGTWAYLVNSSGNKTEWRQPTTMEAIRKTILRSNTFIHSTVMIKKSVLDELGGFNKELEPAEDYDIYLKISNNYPAGNVPSILCEYAAPSGTIYSLKEQWAKIKTKWNAIFNYGYSKKYLVYLITPLIAILLPRRLKVWFKKFLIPNSSLRKHL